MGNWEVKSSDPFEPMLRKLQAKGEAVRSVIVETHFSPTADRTANQNAKIAGIQRHKFKRNPFFLKARDLRELSKMFREAVNKTMRGQRSAIKRAAEDVGRMAVEAYRKHIDSGINTRGPMPPLKKATAIRKAKKHGRRPPILVDTGQLYRSLKFKILFP